MWAKHKQTGFTIVELLIVIVVIGILAAITIVAYNGVSNRARDAKRLQDASGIVKALEIYKTANGSYPNANPNDTSGWEVSKNTPDAFISSLKSSGSIGGLTPVDPINTGGSFYQYYKYPAGNAGCDVTRGAYYLFIIRVLDSQSSVGQGPGFSCSGRDWTTEGAWVTGGYTN